jgi:YegS/Rv2252/BmrU family lipid kinase
MPNATLVFNPKAGRGRAAQLLPDVRAALKAAGVEANVVETKAAGHGSDLAQAAAEAGAPLVIAFGGDGTIREVVQGLVRAAPEGATTTTFGIIPMGTGNDLLKSVKVPTEWRAACALVAQGSARPIDVGRVNGQVFVNMVGIGFDAQVGIEAQKITWLKGPSVYTAALARNMLFSYSTPQVSVQTGEASWQQDITLLTIANGRCSGGTFWLAPEAVVDDGQFDVCVIRGLSKPGILGLVPKVMKGKHITEKPVRMLRTRTITVSSDAPLPVHADGDILYTDAHRLEVEVLPGKLRVIG